MRTGNGMVRLRSLAAILLIVGAHLALTQQRGTGTQPVDYICPMDKDVKAQAPGKCPKCGMELRAAPAGAPAAPVSRAIAERRDGRIDSLAVPDIPVYDQNGRRLRFYTDLVKGKSVAINFIFTTCTTICPPLTATFRGVQRGLGARVGKDIELISVSVDPAVDTPERLQTFAQKFHAGAGWTFVTGSQAEIDKLLEALGAAVSNKNDHTPMILLGNEPARYWTRAHGLASAAKLVEIITDIAEK